MIQRDAKEWASQTRGIGVLAMWEYKSIEFTDVVKFDRSINELGRDGWELTALNEKVAVFQKRLHDEEEYPQESEDESED